MSAKFILYGRGYTVLKQPPPHPGQHCEYTQTIVTFTCTYVRRKEPLSSVTRYVSGCGV